MGDGVLTEHAAAYWSSQAARYDRWGDLAHGHPRYREAWTDALGTFVGHPVRDGTAPRRVADIGCGTGELALLLATMGHNVTGYDIAAGMLERAQANITAARPVNGTVEVTAAESRNLPVEDGSYDVVISRMVFWALPDPVAALGEWRRVLAPGGRIVVIDALHFAQTTTAAGRLRSTAGRLFWTALGWVDRNRGAASAPARPAGPGDRWRSVDEPANLFAAAGMPGVHVDWLDDVAAAHRKTAPLRWRLAGLLPRFYILSWPGREARA